MGRFPSSARRDSLSGSPRHRTRASTLTRGERCAHVRTGSARAHAATTPSTTFMYRQVNMWSAPLMMLWCSHRTQLHTLSYCVDRVVDVVYRCNLPYKHRSRKKVQRHEKTPALIFFQKKTSTSLVFVRPYV